MDTLFLRKCLNETLCGLRDGLSEFSGPSSVAVIFKLHDDHELYIYDPVGLLRGHEIKVERFYFSENSLDSLIVPHKETASYADIMEVEALELDGLLSYGGSSPTVPYQMWFTEHHPDLLSPGPIHRWLEHAILRFSHDIGNTADMYSGISGKFLREYATHAIHNHILSEFREAIGEDSRLNFYDILNTVINVSQTREEGKWASGKLVFIEPVTIENLPFRARFIDKELPRLDNFKHVRKLLQTVEQSKYNLISDGANILGIAGPKLPPFSLTAEFRGRYGYMRMDDRPFCSFSGGMYRSSSLKAKLFEVEEALLDHNLDRDLRDALFHIVATLVHRAQEVEHGCTFVLDLNDTPVRISGQLLEKPLDLTRRKHLEMACAFSKVDGALHIGKDLRMHSFACLLDGIAMEGEDRARGARYNSALRFTAVNKNTIVIVVSSDKPVTVIENGIGQQAHCKWNANRDSAPEPARMVEWLQVS